MKPTLLIAISVSFGILSTVLVRNTGAEETETLMQAKLEHSKSLLEGLATGDFAQLEKSANALTLLSLETDWQVIQTGEYRRLSEDFRRSTNSLQEMAKAKNLDGATLAYVGVTMKCVECHKYVRSVQVGRTSSQE
jgi:hypothetical protein